ncbi:hypothetical protein LTR53_016340 [Teratosphaeriaceae sp. CCFEE 6253]|nr:hypothetical protein LTR53_016340 [Teratosphaeriaceae sp. CCFEE 6253]
MYPVVLHPSRPHVDRLTQHTSIHRKCHYEEPATLASSYTPSSHGSQASSTHEPSRPASVPTQLSSVHHAPSVDNAYDPFRHEALRKPTADAIVHGDAVRLLGSLDRMPAILDSYIDSIHQRFSILSHVRMYERLQEISASSPADFIALCLAVFLVQQDPPPHTKSMQSSLYVSMKSILSLLDAVEYQTLEVVQFKLRRPVFRERRVGYTNVEKRGFAARGRQHVAAQRKLPTRSCRHRGGRAETVPQIVPTSTAHDATLATSYSIRVGQFARECQASNLIARVLRHIYDPSPDLRFQAEEAVQLERTLSAFCPVLMDEQVRFGKYCAALGMCTNALFMLHEDAGKRDATDVLTAMHPLSTQINVFSNQLFGNGEAICYGTLSPYIPLSLYQAAVVQSRLYRRSGEQCYGEALLSLKKLLGYFNRRWLVAGTSCRPVEVEAL